MLKDHTQAGAEFKDVAGPGIGICERVAAIADDGMPSAFGFAEFQLWFVLRLPANSVCTLQGPAVGGLVLPTLNLVLVFIRAGMPNYAVPNKAISWPLPKSREQLFAAAQKWTKRIDQQIASP